MTNNLREIFASRGCFESISGGKLQITYDRQDNDTAMTRHTITRRAIVVAGSAFLIPRVSFAAMAPTPAATEGPFYPVDTTSDDDADLVLVENAVREAGGDLLHLTGRVLDINARPISGARVEIWQCDANGVYRHPGDRRRASRDVAFQGFGHADVDDDGRFAFRTIVPVPYPGRTPHIHVKVWRDGDELLTTQLYRAGYPQNASDFLFRRLEPDERRQVSLVITRRSASPRPVFETDIDLVVRR